MSARPRLVLVAVIAIFAVVGVIVALGSGGSTATSSSFSGTASTSAAPARPNGPVGVSEARLKQLSASLKQPIYWAGPRSGDTYEYRRSANGSIYIRYLPSGAPIGDPRDAFLLVATYPYPDALKRLRDLSKIDPGGFGLKGGGFALPTPSYPTSVHLAFPGVPYEAEVHDPAQGAALKIVQSGDIRAVR